MSYRLDPSKPASEEIRRTAGEQLAAAIVALQAAGDDGGPGPAIHTARKKLKRLRSLLRMVRPQLDVAGYERDMDAGRNVGRRLSAMRDADTSARTVRTLIDESSSPMADEYVDPIASELATRRDAGWDLLIAQGSTLEDALSSLGSLSRNVEKWKLAGIEWETMMEGVARSYRKGRRAGKVAAEQGEPEAFHETRKRTKDLRYQLELVRDAWTPVLSGDAKGADELTDILGRIQDLEVLRATLYSGRGVDWNPDGVDLLLDEIGRRAHALRSGAEIAGTLVYAEKPGDFRKRLHAYVPRTAPGAGSSAAA